MLWRIVAFAPLVLCLAGAPVAGHAQLAAPAQVFPIPEPTPGPTPEAPGSVRSVTQAAAGYTVTVHGGRWPYNPPLPSVGVATPAIAWLLLDVSIANTSASPMRYSVANLRVRLGEDLIFTPDTVGELQPKLGDGQLPGSASSGVAPPTVRGWVTFQMQPSIPSTGLTLDYLPSDAAGGVSTAPLSLPLSIVP